ncbi:aspartate transcarbamylase [Paramecium bursaria Chlorella virus NY2B]|nr:aspartate transcarbamylase [Paramecium bursaria Chlorella virus NY2B]
MIIPTLAPGIENYCAPSWFRDPIKHIVKSQQFSKQTVLELCNLASEFKNVRNDSLRGKKMLTYFEEPSTRTRLSFESAMHDLGGHVLSVENAVNSSKAKGESIEDTVRTVERYADVFVIRSNTAGTAEKAVKVSSISVINAGDGAGQHPSQALLDTYTIHEHFGDLNDLTVAFVGDLLYSRTIHSLVYMLSLFKVRMIFVAPEECKMKYDLMNYLRDVGVQFEESNDLEYVSKIADVVYLSRIQKERFTDRPDDYETCAGRFVMSNMIADQMKHDSIIMHPLPRVDEILPEVDTNHRAIYFNQVERGLEMRKALLFSIFYD